MKIVNGRNIIGKQQLCFDDVWAAVWSLTYTGDVSVLCAEVRIQITDRTSVSRSGAPCTFPRINQQKAVFGKPLTTFLLSFGVLSDFFIFAIFYVLFHSKHHEGIS